MIYGTMIVLLYKENPIFIGEVGKLLLQLIVTK